MNELQLNEKLDNLNRGVQRLSVIATDAAAVSPVEDTAARLRETLEELTVAEEELRVQNEDMLRSRSTLESQRQRYRDLFEFAPDAYFVTDTYGVIREANHTAAELLGMSPQFLLGKPLAVFFPEDDRPVLRGLLRRVVATSRINDYSVRIVPRHGPSVEMSATVVSIASGGPAHALRWLLRDVTERLRAQEEVGRLNDELEMRVAERTAELQRANAAKDEFLGLVSHELRTPITTILGNAEILQRPLPGVTAEQRDLALGDIHGEASRLQRIVDNLLVLARLEQGEQIAREPLAMHRIIERLAREHEQRHPPRQITLSFDAAAMPVEASPFAVEQVLRNLLSNAEKYSPPHMPIEVRTQALAGALEVRVLDRGIGLAPDELRQVFTRFYRSPRAERSASGVGIGLAVCKRLVEAQSGRVWAAPRPEGGAEFGFSLCIDPEDALAGTET